MAQQTLLEMTQDILSRLDSDAVNSISDTVESMQVATIIKNKYYDVLSRGGLPENNKLFQLDPSLDINSPTLMYVPDGVGHIEWIKYFDSDPNDSEQVSQFGSFRHDLNTDITDTSSFITTSTTSNAIGTGTKTFTVASGLTITVDQGVMALSGTSSMTGTVTSYSGTTLVLDITSTVGSGTYTAWTIVDSATTSIPGYKYVTILPIDQFLDMINKFNPADSDVLSFTFSESGNDFTFYYKNDIQPSYCTILSNYYIIFDSYASDFDSTLQGSKTLVYGQLVPAFTMSDTFVPPLDDNQFPLLFNESVALAFYELKQMPNAKAEQEIKRQWSVVQKNKSIVNKPAYFDQLPNYGRMPRTGGYGNSSIYRWMRGTSGI